MTLQYESRKRQVIWLLNVAFTKIWNVNQMNYLLTLKIKVINNKLNVDELQKIRDELLNDIKNN